MYGAGLFRVIALDLRDDRPEVPRTLASRLSHRRQQLQSLKHRITNRRHRITETEPASPKTSAISLRKVQDPESAPATTTAEPTGDILAERPFDGSFRSRQNNSEPEILPVLSRSASISTIDAKVEDNPPTGISPALDPTSHPHESVRSVVVKRIKAFASPPTVAVIVSLLVALVPPLKALMVPVEGWSGSKISNAPDGGAPLAFLYDVRSPYPICVQLLTNPTPPECRIHRSDHDASKSDHIGRSVCPAQAIAKAIKGDASSCHCGYDRSETLHNAYNRHSQYKESEQAYDALSARSEESVKCRRTVAY